MIVKAIMANKFKAEMHSPRTTLCGLFLLCEPTMKSEASC